MLLYSAAIPRPDGSLVMSVIVISLCRPHIGVGHITAQGVDRAVRDFLKENNVYLLSS